MSEIKTTARSEIKRLVYANPDMSSADVLASLAERGISTTLSSVESYRSDFLNSVAVLKDLGAFAAAAPAAPKKGKKAKPPSRPQRWADAASRAAAALADLREVQEEYEGWRDGLPENLQSSGLAEKLGAVCDIDLESAISAVDEAESIDLPMGFGRD